VSAPSTDEALARLARRAQSGERAALEELLGALQDDVYNLAVRMLWHPEDAEDATQEILVKVATRLSSYRGEAAVRTWTFRVAANHLATTRRRRMERAAMTFDRFAADLAEGLADPSDHGVDEALLEQEVKLGCTQAMLLCLDREHRLALILGIVFGVSSTEAAEILDVAPATYRKRLQRARARIGAFLEGHCGLVDPRNTCRCARRIDAAVACRRVVPDRLLFADRRRRSARLARGVAEMERLHAAAAILRSHPDYRASARVLDGVVAAVRSRPLSLLDDR
jgi:RNA polymerase sigma factor (sigma-70 family)